MAEIGQVMQQNETLVSCEYCGALEKLLRCANCKRVYYCSKAHQKRHWKIHKKVCGVKNIESNASNFPNEGGGDVINMSQHQNTAISLSASSSICDKNAGIVNIRPEDSTTTRKISDISFQFADRNHPSTNSEGVNNELLLNSRMGNNSNAAKSESINPGLRQKYKMYSGLAEQLIANKERMNDMCNHVLRDLNEFGICVIDQFVGHDLGDSVLGEVETMYRSGVFEDGAVVNNRSRDSSTSIRSDKIAWIDETNEKKCPHITDLIKIIDKLVTMCFQLPNNGAFSKYESGGRTKAMIACYPGADSHYVKHVDNPNNDGRFLTVIYYLNKDWTEECGGILRIFPEGNDQMQAMIKPIFDRILFFWSDRRNPHEVEAAKTTRYAITVWYYDKKEKEKAQLNGTNGMASIGIS